MSVVPSSDVLLPQQCSACACLPARRHIRQHALSSVDIAKLTLQYTCQITRRDGIMARVAAAMLANQEIDRELSAKACAELTFNHGAPGTQAQQDVVITIWEMYCVTISHE